MRKNEISHSHTGTAPVYGYTLRDGYVIPTVNSRTTVRKVDASPKVGYASGWGEIKEDLKEAMTTLFNAFVNDHTELQKHYPYPAVRVTNNLFYLHNITFDSSDHLFLNSFGTGEVRSLSQKPAEAEDTPTPGDTHWNAVMENLQSRKTKTLVI